MKQGFTLLEMSIVLVLIGLIAGGVLVSSQLIAAGEITATIAQVDRFREAANTFDQKFGGIPGDIQAALASANGLSIRNGAVGRGDGNGLIDGNGGPGSLLQGGGETGLFWVDLTTANGLSLNLLDQSFFTATQTLQPNSQPSTIGLYMPEARLGRGNYFYVYETNNQNYYGLSAVTSLSSGVMTSSPTLTVIQAYTIDKKIDDGLPQSGKVIAYYVDQGGVYAAAGGGGYSGGQVGVAGTLGAVPGPTSCYDNQGSSGATQNYSITYNKGNFANCALSFEY